MTPPIRIMMSMNQIYLTSQFSLINASVILSDLDAETDYIFALASKCPHAKEFFTIKEFKTIKDDAVIMADGFMGYDGLDAASGRYRLNIMMSTEKMGEHTGNYYDVIIYVYLKYDLERIDDMTYAQTQEIKLSNGESLPLLTEVLSEADKQNKTKLIIEIKPHDTQQKENDAVDAVLELVRHAKMEKKVEYISFSRNICERLISKEPKAKVAYLGGELTPQQLCDLGYSGLDYHIATMRAHEDWFDEAKRLGLTVNVWTVDDEENMKWLIEKHADYITTNQPVVLQRLLNDR